MTHKRILIRSFIRDLLAGRVALAQNIFTSRTQSVNADELSSVTIITPEEISEPRNLAATALIRTVTIKIEARPEINVFGADESVDLLLEEIEGLIFEDPTLGGLVSGLVLTSSVIVFDDEGEKPMAVGVLTFEAKYFT